MKSKETICVVAPVYNEFDNLDNFYLSVKEVLQKSGLEWSILFVNDGSTDQSQKKIQQLSLSDSRVKILSLTRNFGKESALTAGLDYVDADAVIPIDTDLQDPPILMLEMIRYWKEGFDIVYAKRKERKGETFFKILTAGLFYKIINKLSDIEIPENVGDYRLMSRRVVDDVNKIREKNRFMKGVFSWVGYTIKEIYFNRDERNTGKSSFNFTKLFNLALDGITSFSIVPLRIFFYLGLIILLLSMVYASFIILRIVIFGVDLPGYASLMVIILFLGGLNLFAVGFMGEYIGRIYQEVKSRPIYLINKKESSVFDKVDDK